MSPKHLDERVAFLIAGVQKAGTTALFDYLGEEPGVSLSTDKEAHFFDEYMEPHLPRVRRLAPRC